MKAFIFLSLAALVAAASADTQVFEKCTLQNPPTIKPFNYKQMAGAWFHVRQGPLGPFQAKFEKMDCTATYAYQEHGGPADHMTLLTSTRKNKEEVFTKNLQVPLKPLEEGLYENNFRKEDYELPNPTGEGKMKVSYQARLIDTDEGHSYCIWAKCLEMPDKNSTLLWIVESRAPTMDSKLEQMLVEKIEKYSGVTPSQLRGISHSHCHGH